MPLVPRALSARARASPSYARTVPLRLVHRDLPSLPSRVHPRPMRRGRSFDDRVHSASVVPRLESEGVILETRRRASLEINEEKKMSRYKSNLGSLDFDFERSLSRSFGRLSRRERAVQDLGECIGAESSMPRVGREWRPRRIPLYDREGRECRARMNARA